MTTKRYPATAGTKARAKTKAIADRCRMTTKDTPKKAKTGGGPEARRLEETMAGG
jgi:hypothetical protein